MGWWQLNRTSRTQSLNKNPAIGKLVVDLRFNRLKSSFKSARGGHDVFQEKTAGKMIELSELQIEGVKKLQ
jgi:hypothetical protein